VPAYELAEREIFGYSFYSFSNSRQFQQEMAIFLKDAPKLSGHRKDDSRIGNVSKRRPPDIPANFRMLASD